jgi:hypothetical protein
MQQSEKWAETPAGQDHRARALGKLTGEFAGGFSMGIQGNFTRWSHDEFSNLITI